MPLWIGIEEPKRVLELIEVKQDNVIEPYIEPAIVFEIPEWMEKPIEIVSELQEKKEYYLQFSGRELAYIVHSGEITEEYVMEILETLRLKGITIRQEYAHYDVERTAITSQEILDIPITYKGWTVEDFANAYYKDGFNMGHDKCIYFMGKLGIWDRSKWVSLTGYKGKGEKFLPEVAKNIGEVVDKISDVVGDVIGDVLKGALDVALDVAKSFWESLLGENWKEKLIIGFIIVIGIIIAVLIGYFYVKTYVGAKALKRATT